MNIQISYLLVYTIVKSVNIADKSFTAKFYFKKTLQYLEMILQNGKMYLYGKSLRTSQYAERFIIADKHLVKKIFVDHTLII